VLSARIMSAAYSAGPKPTAMPTRGRATIMSISTLKVPAMNEAQAAMPSAGPARPCLAIW
jgi:hypothetical protein